MMQNSSEPPEKAASDQPGYLGVLEVPLHICICATECEFITSKIKLLTGSGIRSGLTYRSMARLYGIVKHKPE